VQKPDKSSRNMNIQQSPLSRELKRVVLIGSRGFIGATLQRQLAMKGVPTLALTSSDVDLTDASAFVRLVTLLKPTDSVVMLAALTPEKGRDIATLMKNLAMMENVCAAIEKIGCTHFVYFSSDAVYDTAVSHVSEATPASPQDLYGAMHCTREIMARSLGKVPLLILRPTLVYGLNDTHNSYGVNRFRRAAQKEGKITLFGGGEENRDHIHVDDVAAIAIRCLFRYSTGILNVATGTSKSFIDVAEFVSAQFARKIEIAATSRQNPVTHRHFDVTNLIKMFPDFRFIPLKDGIASVHHEAMRSE
jgi:UDP-glucose 4-epimerase